MFFQSLEKVCNDAMALAKAGENDRAERLLSIAMMQYPNRAELQFCAGSIQLNKGLDGIAIPLLERSAELNRNYSPAWVNLGYAYRRAARIDDARQALRKAIEIKPDDRDAWLNLACCFINEGAAAEGEPVARKAVEMAPENPRTHWNLGLLLLEQNKYREGWREYAYGLDSAERMLRNYAKGEAKTPLLESLDAIKAGEVVCVYGEQGIGDEILFTSMLAELIEDVRARGGDVVLDCHPRLEAVFRRNFDVPIFPTRKQEYIDWPLTQRVDWVMPMGNLGSFYRNSLQDFPDHHGYLIGNEERAASYRERLEAKADGRPIVGIAWSGGIRKTMAHYRHIPLAEWLPLLNQDALWVSLQYNDHSEEIRQFAHEHGIEILDFPAITQHFDYDETFALVGALDLTITAPTSVLHVAGAIGSPCWVVMHHKAAWRECSPDESIPWYPKSHLRFVRGDGQEGWDKAIEAVSATFAEYLKGRKAA